MTAPDNEIPQQVVVVGPDGRPVGTMAMPMGADDGDGDGGSAAWSSSRPRSCGSAR